MASTLDGTIAHIQPAQTSDPAEQRRIKRRKVANLETKITGTAQWVEDPGNSHRMGYVVEYKNAEGTT